MAIPSSVRILGLTYSVTFEDIEDDDGYISPRRQAIVISSRISEEKAEQVLLHEVVHGILDQLGYLDLYEDERLVQGLAIGLHQALSQG